jgi:putative flippase GtrA
LIKWATGIIRRFWSVRFLRFLVVGGVNTIFGYLVYASFILLNLHYSLALLISTIIGVIFNFFTTGRIVFDNRRPSLILKFFAVYVVYYLLNLGALKLLTSQGISSLVSGAIAVLPMACVSYLLNRTFVFKPNKETAR